MCEIIKIPCKICKIGIEIHLGGYETKSSEIEVFCRNHIPEKDIVIWDSPKTLIFSNKASPSKMYGYGKVGIRALTENAKQHKDEIILIQIVIL